MMLHVVLVTEVFATVMCIHSIYGRKLEWDIKTVAAILGILTILEVANVFRLSGISSLIIFVIIYAYCRSMFKKPIIENVISLVLCMIIVTSTQFIFSSVVRMIITEEYLRSAVSNIAMVHVFALHFVRCGMNKLQRAVVRKSKFVVVSSCFMCLIVLLMLLQGKVFYEIQMQYFTLVVPAVFMILYLIVQWYCTQTEVEKKEKEIRITKENKKEYDNLLTKVRLRQHELKNHISAIFSAHYTYKTYEQLVQAQEEYCNRLLHENKYNNLLMLGDNVLTGFLHGKFREAEADGIEIRYKIGTRVNNIQVPTYYVIEMLGILFDNAVEALKDCTEKVIFFEVYEVGNEYELSIKNPYSYVSYDEILEWFQLEKSEKGRGRGLGLYHLKCLCNDWNCDIQCGNTEIDKKNWIEFKLKIGKADNE